MTVLRLILIFILTGLATAKHSNQHKTPQKNRLEPDGHKPCILRNYGTNGKKVCVCNATYCDTVPKPQKVKASQYILYTSNKAGLRFAKKIGNFKNEQKWSGSFVDSSRNKRNVIHINPDDTMQTMLGWGGAFTDSTGINIKSLPEQAQELLMESYFADDGIEYSMCRVPIGGTDFSTHPYTYDDSDQADPYLKNFALAKEDLEYKIPFIKQALKLRNNKLNIFGSPWAAPAWMKTNNQLYGKGVLKKEFWQPWADYFVKFLEKYKEQGVPIWGITTQNEPSMAYLLFKDIPTVGWTSVNQTLWIENNLGPTIRNSSFPNTTIIILDDQKPELPWYTNSILQEENARKYILGIAIHWYMGTITPCRAMTETHRNFPDQFIMSTEGCNSFQNSSGPDLGNWEYGENYSTDIIENTHCWVVGWVDWNMVLDPQGGPTYINNFVDAPIIVNASAGEFYKQPMYYHLGHHSKFVPPGSLHIKTEAFVTKNVMVAAYLTPDKGIVVVILNKSNNDETIIIDVKSGCVAEFTITKRSINTFLSW